MSGYSWNWPCCRTAGREREEKEMKNVIAKIFAGAALVALSVSSAAAQDVEAGQKSFNKCRPCHQVGETAKNIVGPLLNGLIGRKSGTIDGYNYSDANKNSGITWDEATFAEYIKKPAAKIPGTKMVFAGIANEQEIKDLTAFLKSYDKDGKKK